MNKLRLYWICQIFGWGGYVFLIGILNRLESNTLYSLPFIFNAISTFVIGITTTHFYRFIIIRFHWLSKGFLRLIPSVLLMSVALASAFYFVHSFISEFVIAGRFPEFDFLEVFKNVLNLTANYVLWTLFYWLFHFVENYKKEEIKNLKWQAAKNEIELNKLKSQLNPHFIFNSMNSIRALVDEDPARAKNAINQLSNILRNSLLMGKQAVISFKEEMELVRDYLALEKTRFEERLEYDITTDSEADQFLIPPMMIQTLVENGIKHGISKLPKGGKIEVTARVHSAELELVIINDGAYVTEGATDPKKGFGIENTRHRLHLLYGSKASFAIHGIAPSRVEAKLIIPLQPTEISFN